MKIIGISGLYHDSAVAAVEDGSIRFAIHEERLSRFKHDARFPIMAIAKALETCQWHINDVDQVVFYENPKLKLDRIFNQVLDSWPRSWDLFSDYLPNFCRYKYPVETIIRDTLRYRGRIRCIEHHLSHAASVFYTSPFDKALVLTVDGVGESETTVVYLGQNRHLKKLAALHFPHSLGLLYSVFTQFLGFEVNGGEYKVMGLAPYGKPTMVNRILDKMLFLDPDGSYHLDPRYFNFISRLQHYSHEFVQAVGMPPRQPNDPMTSQYQDLAASIQSVLEMALTNLLTPFLQEYRLNQVCMAGGVALNCTANAHLIRTLGIELCVHPAAGDAGGALGAALYTTTEAKGNHDDRFTFQPYLGTACTDSAIEATLKLNNLAYRKLPDITKEIAVQLAAGDVVGVLQGRDEWGPRALGNRCILADPRSPGMKDHLNAKIKFREEFRPFAPVIMAEHFAEYFDTLGMSASPYMLFTHKNHKGAAIPSAVHVDNTSRVQTVSKSENPYLYSILEEFYLLTGVPVLILTSFNLKGEAMVCTASDALKTFYASGIDFLALESFWVTKSSSKP